MLALKQWAGKKSEREGISFAWWMVDKIHNILVFKEMNHDGAATKVAEQFAKFYRGKRVPKSSNSNKFRTAVNVIWFTLRGLPLSDQYSSHIEYIIACRVVYGLMVSKLSEKKQTTDSPKPPQKRAWLIAGKTFVACVHDALERSDQSHEAATVISPPETQDVALEATQSPVQLTFRW